MQISSTHGRSIAKAFNTLFMFSRVNLGCYTKLLAIILENLDEEMEIRSGVFRKKHICPFGSCFFILCYEILATTLAGRFCVARGNDASNARGTNFACFPLVFPKCFLSVYLSSVVISPTMTTSQDIIRLGTIILTELRLTSNTATNFLSDLFMCFGLYV